MSIKFVVIIQCDIAKLRCSGFACTKSFYDREGFFKDLGYPLGRGRPLQPRFLSGVGRHPVPVRAKDTHFASFPLFAAYNFCIIWSCKRFIQNPKTISGLFRTF